LRKKLDLRAGRGYLAAASIIPGINAVQSSGLSALRENRTEQRTLGFLLTTDQRVPVDRTEFNLEELLQRKIGKTYLRGL